MQIGGETVIAPATPKVELADGVFFRGVEAEVVTEDVEAIVEGAVGGYIRGVTGVVGASVVGAVGG